MEQIILNYIRIFLGYGNLKSTFWNVAMDEGGGNRWNELHARFTVWAARGAVPVEDLREFHLAIRITRWFIPAVPLGPIPLQPTWRQMIRVFLNATGVAVAIPGLQAFQANQLGRQNTPPVSPCVFDLMPLPRAGQNAWPYAHLAQQYPQLSFLADRATYFAEVRPPRIELLRNCIKKHRPKVVCFYAIGKKYLVWWNEIAGVALQPQPLHNPNGQLLGNFCIAQGNGTLFVVARHPTEHGVTNDYFDAVGRRVAEIVPGL